MTLLIGQEQPKQIPRTLPHLRSWRLQERQVDRHKKAVNTGVLPPNACLISTIWNEGKLLEYSASLSNNRDNSQASLPPGSFGLRRSYTLVRGGRNEGCANPAILPQKSRKGRLHTSSQLSESTLHVEGCAPRRALRGLLQNRTVSGAILDTSAEDTCSSSYCGRRCTTHTAESFTHKKNMHTREILDSPSTGSALFTMGYAYAHVPEISASCTEPAREPWGAGGRFP